MPFFISGEFPYTFVFWNFFIKPEWLNYSMLLTVFCFKLTEERDEKAAQLGEAGGSKEKQEERREAEEKAQAWAGILEITCSCTWRSWFLNSELSHLFFHFWHSGTDGSHCEFTKRTLKAITKERLAEALISGPKLCVDLSMTDSMSDKVADWPSQKAPFSNNKHIIIIATVYVHCALFF